MHAALSVQEDGQEADAANQLEVAEKALQAAEAKYLEIQKVRPRGSHATTMPQQTLPCTYSRLHTPLHDPCTQENENKGNGRNAASTLPELSLPWTSTAMAK